MAKNRISSLATGRVKLLVFLFVCMMAILVFMPKATPGGSTEPDVLVRSAETPNEEKVPEQEPYAWKGAKTDPKFIELPSIGAQGYIQKVGIDQNNEIAAPSNINMAAWFIKSSRPGQPGLSIIDGHVTGQVYDGIFKNLSKIKSGERYRIQLGSGEIKEFEVFGMKTVMAEEAVNHLFSQYPRIKSQLNLITCGGTYNPQTKRYDKRVIVYSKLVE